MSQTSSSMRALSLLASVAVHATVLATVPALFGERGTGPAESSSTLQVSILRSEPADDIPRVNPDLSELEQQSEQAKPSPDLLKEHSISPKPLVIQKPKTTSAPNSSSGQPASDQRGADVRYKQPMQVARSGKYTRQSRDYRSSLLRLIERHKYYPIRARRSGIEGKATVSFTVSNNGKIRNVVIARSSHRPILDQAALQAIKRIGQAPPLPDGRNRWQFTVPLTYRIR